MQSFISILEEIIKERKTGPSKGSYTKLLFNKGNTYIERKVMEEALEAIIESHDGNKDKLIEETSDLFYHLLLLLAYHNLSFKDIESCLEQRHKILKKDRDAQQGA